MIQLFFLASIQKYILFAFIVFIVKSFKGVPNSQ